jgi:hypothetical protein
MPSISIGNGLKTDIIVAMPDLAGGFGKYLKDPASLLADVNVFAELQKPLTDARSGDLGFGLSWAKTNTLGEVGPALGLNAGGKAVLTIFNEEGAALFEETFIGTPVEVTRGRAYVAFAIRPSLGVDVERTIGSLTFGFSAGSEIELKYFHPFDVGKVVPSAADACKTTLEQFIVPNRSGDIFRMRSYPEGAIACSSGHGELQVSVTADLAAAFNPLASVNTLPQLGTLTVGGGASASLAVAVTVSGDFQIRVEKKTGSIVHLSYHTMAGRALEVSLTGSAGASVALGDRELLAMLFSGPGGVPKAADKELTELGIGPDHVERITSAMRAGLSRKLEVAIGAAFSASTQDDAAFLYEVDLDRLDGTGAAAIDAALSGDLKLLNRFETFPPSHGIRVLRSKTQLTREKAINWRINLVGLVNVLSMASLVRTGTIAHDEESGELVIADSVSSSRMGGLTAAGQIRRLLYESTLMSLTYKALGVNTSTSLAIEQTFFFLDRHANHQRISDYLDAFTALKLLDRTGADKALGREDDFGKASLLLETAFDDEASRRVFSVPAGRPARAAYEKIGREALRALVKKGDPDDYRLKPLEDDPLWQAMKDAGQAQFRFVLPAPITGGNESRQAIRVGVVTADYSVIVWWAGAMAVAAEGLASMREFLRGRDPIGLDTDPEFQRRRRAVEESVVKAVRSNQSTFDDPWGLVALFLAAAGAATARARLVSPKLTLDLPRG